MIKNGQKKRKRFSPAKRDPTEKKWQVRVHWLLRFLIEAERLEIGDLSKAPFEILDVERMLGRDFVPHAIQNQAWVAIYNRQFLFLVSGTGSGKTMGIIPGIIEALLKNMDAHCQIIYPMKALAQDQEWRLREWCSEHEITVQRYDSSIPKKVKEKIRRNPGDILIITPDTLMGSIVATQNEEWHAYLTTPSMIWVDEFHAMSGTLGTALSYLVRILHNLHPALRVFFTSATLANVAEIVKFFPQSPEVVKGGSRHGKIKFYVGTIKDLEAVMEVVLHDEGQFLLFIENKRLIEELITKNDLLARRVNQYHADLPDSERHLILSKFSKRELRGLLCTSAVSLGVDIPGVKNIVLYGFPRSFSLLFQEMGRGTRDFESSGRVFLLLDDSKLIDSYYCTHLEELEKDIRTYRSDPMIIDLLNEKILRGMVLFAIKLGLGTRERLAQVFKEASSAGKLEQTVTWLLIKGFISKNKEGYIYFKEPANHFLLNFISNLRPGFPKFKILTQMNDEEVELGSINAENIPHRACKGNYYNRENRCFLIKEIDADKREIRAEEIEEHFVSRNQVSTSVSMIDELKFKKTLELKIRLADFRVQVRPEALQNFKVIKNVVNEVPEKVVHPNPRENFNLEFDTRGLTLEIDSSQLLRLSQSVLYQLSKILLRNAAVMINVSENEVDCYQNLDWKMLYFLDRSCPTGVCQQLYENIEAILKKTYQVLASCSCDGGCDKCSIPIESNYLIPQFQSEDRYNKDEMLEVLRRCLHESLPTK